jgi:anti-sigma B factor antagonist
MELQEEVRDGATLLSLSGRIDGSNAGELEERLMEYVGQDARIVLDFSSVPYISSAGLRVMLSIAKGLSACKGKLVLCNLQAAVLAIFEMCGFVEVLAIVDTLEEAIQKVQEGN